MWLVFFLIGVVCVVLLLKTAKKSDSFPTARPDTTERRRSNLSERPSGFSQNKSGSPNFVIDTYIAGVPHRLGRSVVLDNVFKVGQSLQAERDPNNVHDCFAIKLLVGPRFVGFVPRAHSRHVANYIDLGGAVNVTVTGLNSSDIWRGVSIKITT